jgi:hypothetical protein
MSLLAALSTHQDRDFSRFKSRSLMCLSFKIVEEKTVFSIVIKDTFESVLIIPYLSSEGLQSSVYTFMNQL